MIPDRDLSPPDERSDDVATCRGCGVRVEIEYLDNNIHCDDCRAYRARVPVICRCCRFPTNIPNDGLCGTCIAWREPSRSRS